MLAEGVHLLTSTHATPTPRPFSPPFPRLTHSGREFLDRVCTKTVDCDQGVTYSYDCSYSKFQKQKAERLAQWNKSYEAQMKKVKSEKDWINRFKVGAQAAQAASRQKKLEKWQASDDWIQRPPTPGKPLRFRFPDPPRMGNAEVPDITATRPLRSTLRPSP
jgi:ATPase subunit of ABC transporter with duplicated ATPase domains